MKDGGLIAYFNVIEELNYISGTHCSYDCCTFELLVPAEF